MRLFTTGARNPFEAIFVSPNNFNSEPSIGPDRIPPLVVVLHGGPHSVTQTNFSRTAAFLSALGYSLLHVNYRYSRNFCATYSFSEDFVNETWNWQLNVQDAKTKELTTGVNLFCWCRGSVGFGEEALQSLPGNVGHQVYICVPLLVLLNFWAWWLLEVLEFTNPRFLGCIM